jgi:N utilization substance protein A
VTQEIVDAVKALEQEKGIAADTLMDALEDALLSAYKKTPGAAKYATVELDHGSADFLVYELKVPEDLEQRLLDEQFEAQIVAAEEAEARGEEIERDLLPKSAVDPETGERREPAEPELEPERLEPFLADIKRSDVTPDNFGRIAAQTAKQVILQRIREAERGMMYEEYKDRVGELVTGIIQQSDNRYTLVQLRERVEALLPRSEQVYNERYDHGMRVKAVITDVSAENKGPSIVVSRRNPELIKKLFALEVPEIADNLVEITGVAREPGWRSKIAVISHADGVDPVGACVGPRGSRVRMVVSELRGEKIDIIPYNEEPARFVAKALSPARVREVLVDDETKEATVIVPDDQLSLAIGRDGQNARLAARLTGWKVDITSETEFAQQDDDIEYEGEEAADGRCMAVLTTGRRCPNAALDGSQFCGLPQHQSLARFKTNQALVLDGLTDEQITTLSNPDADADEVKAIVEPAEATFDEQQAAAAAAEAERVAAAEAEAEAAAKAEAEAAEAEAAEAEAEGDEDEDEDAEDEAVDVEEGESSDDAEEDSDDAAPEAEATEEEPAAEDAADDTEETAEEAPEEAADESTDESTEEKSSDDGDTELVSEEEGIVDQQEAAVKAAEDSSEE